MRLIISLIILVFTICNIVRAENISNLYVNLIAYKDSKCQNVPSFGYGYSTAVNTCTTYDFKNDFSFSVNNNIVSYSSYKGSGLGYNQDCQGTPESSNTFKVNSCISSNSLSLNTANQLANGIPFYYKVSTSSVPYSPPTGTYVNTLMGGTCGNDNIVTLQYYVNGTSLIDGPSSKDTLFCENDEAIDWICSGSTVGKCKKNYSTFPCLPIAPFYNSTDSSYSSACAFTCCSGTCSGTSSGTQTGGSGTGEGWADKLVVKNTDKLNNNKFGSGSSSDNGGRYYSSRYCS